MASKKIPISLTRADFNYLNYIQQGSIYSGKSLSNSLTISDILKSVVLESMLKVYLLWEEQGAETMKRFLEKSGEANPVIPKTSREFEMDMKNHFTEERLKVILGDFKHEPFSDPIMRNAKPENSSEALRGKEPLIEPGVTNFILVLNDDEMKIFDGLKLVIEHYKKSTISYSEMTRILFRNLFVDVPRDAEPESERYSIILSIYVMGLYGFNAVESILLFRGITGFFVKIPKEKLERLKVIYSDEVILDAYLNELSHEATRIFNEQSKKNKFLRGRSFDPVPGLLPIDDMNLNKSLDEKYRSAISDFSFHSAYLGFHLLYTEWFFNQHKFPLLVSYFNGKDKKGHEFGRDLTLVTKDLFPEILKSLYSFSKHYRDNP